jgi:hypothetical protein
MGNSIDAPMSPMTTRGRLNAKYVVLYTASYAIIERLSRRSDERPRLRRRSSWLERAIMIVDHVAPTRVAKPMPP